MGAAVRQVAGHRIFCGADARWQLALMIRCATGNTYLFGRPNRRRRPEGWEGIARSLPRSGRTAARRLASCHAITRPAGWPVCRCRASTARAAEAVAYCLPQPRRGDREREVEVVDARGVASSGHRAGRLPYVDMVTARRTRHAGGGRTDGDVLARRAPGSRGCGGRAGGTSEGWMAPRRGTDTAV